MFVIFMNASAVSTKNVSLMLCENKRTLNYSSPYTFSGYFEYNYVDILDKHR